MQPYESLYFGTYAMDVMKPVCKSWLGNKVAVSKCSPPGSSVPLRQTAAWESNVSAVLHKEDSFIWNVSRWEVSKKPWRKIEGQRWCLTGTMCCYTSLLLQLSTHTTMAKAEKHAVIWNIYNHTDRSIYSTFVSGPGEVSNCKTVAKPNSLEQRTVAFCRCFGAPHI